ncbi:MAG: hypothetical protein JW878_10775 [Methanomicrobia archaeon]|nr:hypothetical protein [Methanomicrobia archaeon]
MALFAGCVEEEETPTATPLPEPKYSSGDVIAEKNINEDMATLVLDYDPETDEYKTTYINKVDGVWLYRAKSDHEKWWDREFMEEYKPVKLASVDLSEIMSWDEYWEGGGYEEVHATPTPTATPKPTSTPTPKPKKWHSVTSFSGSGDKTTSSFTIKGDEWRVEYEAKSDKPEYAGFGVHVYRKGATMSVSSWDCFQEECSDTQYIYRGEGDYYFEVIAANLDSWNLKVEDYY